MEELEKVRNKVNALSLWALARRSESKVGMSKEAAVVSRALHVDHVEFDV